MCPNLSDVCADENSSDLLLLLWSSDHQLIHHTQMSNLAYPLSKGQKLGFLALQIRSNPPDYHRTGCSIGRKMFSNLSGFDIQKELTRKFEHFFAKAKCQRPLRRTLVLDLSKSGMWHRSQQKDLFLVHSLEQNLPMKFLGIMCSCLCCVVKKFLWDQCEKFKGIVFTSGKPFTQLQQNLVSAFGTEYWQRSFSFALSYHPYLPIWLYQKIFIAFRVHLQSERSTVVPTDNINLHNCL